MKHGNHISCHSDAVGSYFRITKPQPTQYTNTFITKGNRLNDTSAKKHFDYFDDVILAIKKKNLKITLSQECWMIYF